MRLLGLLTLRDRAETVQDAAHAGIVKQVGKDPLKPTPRAILVPRTGLDSYAGAGLKQLNDIAHQKVLIIFVVEGVSTQEFLGGPTRYLRRRGAGV